MAVTRRQGVEDDNMNIICLDGRTTGSAVGWDLIRRFLMTEFSNAERHLRRLVKVASLDQRGVRHEYRASR